MEKGVTLISDERSEPILKTIHAETRLKKGKKRKAIVNHDSSYPKSGACFDRSSHLAAETQSRTKEKRREDSTRNRSALASQSGQASIDCFWTRGMSSPSLDEIVEFLRSRIRKKQQALGESSSTRGQRGRRGEKEASITSVRANSTSSSSLSSCQPINEGQDNHYNQDDRRGGNGKLDCDDSRFLIER